MTVQTSVNGRGIICEVSSRAENSVGKRVVVDIVTSGSNAGETQVLLSLVKVNIAKLK